jgi:hypothetical protein
MSSRESPSGFHFWNLYQNCHWKFFLRYVMGMIPLQISKHLLYGIAIHGAKAQFYATGSIDEAVGEFDKIIQASESQYEKPEDYILDSNRGPTLLRYWYEDVGKADLTDYDVFSIEQELNPILPNGFRVTLRPDTIFKTKGTKELLIAETKTSGFSKSVTEEALNFSDQVTMYIWGVKQSYPKESVMGVLPDVMYQNKSKIKCAPRGDIIFRTDKELRDFELSTMGILTEISQKIQAVKSGLDPAIVFDRNTSWCTSYNKPCEYIGICRNWNLKGVPSGFEKSDWIEEKETLALVPEVQERYEAKE